ncbi:U1 small nuclear ribonucleoprotein 70 kDa [Cocos nucifera]|uniref:U1 small nuclear ribonucleoprotein 70 kDa n=1 Tax=Cocos nucifera TaxID=13894 RepID=A0A8K0ILD3_COCNU|nr:U1 small nuclear ribonucleoprotein 70 kDa [Cocos nucifera]
MGDYNDAMMRNNAAVQARTKAQNRANVLQLKLIGQSHPTGLTTNLLKLFEPRPPLEYKPPIDKRKCPPYTGMAQLVSHFAEPGDPEYAPPVKCHAINYSKGWPKGYAQMLLYGPLVALLAQKRARIHKLRLEKGAIKAAEELEKYDPQKDPNITGDPYKTLFVARLNYETTEHRIKREFEAYGPIKRNYETTEHRIKREFEAYGPIKRHHVAAYKQADGRKVDGKRVLVDVERGRTVPNWRPRRLGGGLGSTRIGGEEVNQKYSGREQQQVTSEHARSEEPRSRDDRHLDRDKGKSRERGKERERERERSHERSYDKARDRDAREDRHHHRDRDRNRDRDRERDHGRDRDRARDRDRERDRGRDYDRDRERDRDRPRERERERDRDYDHASHERDRGHTHDRDADHDYIEPKHDRELPEMKASDFDHGEPNHGRDWSDGPKHGNEHDYPYEHQRNQKQYDFKLQGLGDPQNDTEPRNHVPYDKVDHVNYPSRFNHVESESREEGEAFGDEDYEYHRSERSHSHEYGN